MSPAIDSYMFYYKITKTLFFVIKWTDDCENLLLSSDTDYWQIYRCICKYNATLCILYFIIQHDGNASLCHKMADSSKFVYDLICVF